MNGGTKKLMLQWQKLERKIKGLQRREMISIGGEGGGGRYNDGGWRKHLHKHRFNTKSEVATIIGEAT